jgi:NifU-like protein involved in Fe-S cluster formation
MKKAVSKEKKKDKRKDDYSIRIGDVESNGQNWLYSEKVKDHFFNPRNIFHSREEEERYEREADGIGQVGSPACGDVMKMYIKVKGGKITECKWKTFGSLIKGEKIMIPGSLESPIENITINSIILNEDGNPTIVEENHVQEYEGIVLTFILSTSNYYNFTVTPNHPFPCIERDKISKVIRNNEQRWSEVDNKKVGLAETVLKSASEIKHGDFMLFKVNKSESDEKELTEDFCTLLGYYVSDGNAPSRKRTIFYFGLHEIDYVNEIRQISEKNGWDHKIYPRSTEKVICIQINNQKITSLLLKHGGFPGNKNFSETINILPPHKQMRIVNSYVNGDGWITKQNENWEEQYFISTSKVNLAYQLQMMLARNKIFAPIHFRKPREFISKGIRYKNNGEYNLIFRKNKQYSRIKYHPRENSFLIPISNIISSKYSGKIYDLGISNEPKVYKIKGISIHNCASALASTSVLSEMVKGMTLEEAKKITPKEIVAALGGLPPRKIHCSVLGDQALRAAIEDYEKKMNRKNLAKGKVFPWRS